MAELTEKRLFLLDMDGTLYLDDDLFPGTVPFLRRIREKGGRYLFLTNNSSRGADSYVEKLRRLPLFLFILKHTDDSRRLELSTV